MGVELRDNLGLICGFLLRPGAPAADIDLVAIDTANPPACPVWLHFNLNDARARQWLGGCAWLAAESREALLASDRGVRLEIAGGGIAGVLADAFADDPETFGVFHLFVDPLCLITGRQHPMASIASMRRHLAGGEAVDDPSALLVRLFGELGTCFGSLVTGYAEFVDDAEDRVFAGGYQEASLGQHRRVMARLRRHVSADRHVLIDLLANPAPWLDRAAAKDLRRLAARLTAVGQELDLVEERARLLTEEIDSRLTERTNRHLYIVSLAAAVFLPITLISGVFGMNVGGLPWLEDGNGFVWVMACMAAAIVVAFTVIYWRRMF